MIKIPVGSRTNALAKVLDEVIAKNPPRRQIGGPNPNPKLSEEDLFETIRTKKDVTVAIPNVDAFYLDNIDEKKIMNAAGAVFPKNELISLSGRFHYPKNGFMGWHTNSNALGWRMYATWCEDDKKSYFRYYDMKKKQLITEWEDKGWNFRAFKVEPGKLYWHCVYSDTNRYSFGFRFKI